MNFRIGGKKLDQHATEPQRLVTEPGPHPLFSRRRGITLIED